MMPICAALVISFFGARAGAQSFESWSAKAQKAQKKGADAEAVEYWTEALRLWTPETSKARRAKALAAKAKALSSRAEAETKTGDVEQALKDLDEALALDKKSPAMFDRRGQVYLARGDTKRALADFYAAAKLNIDYGPAYLHRAQAYEKQGDGEFAREDYRTACRLGVKAGCAAAKKVVVKKPKAAPLPAELARPPAQAAASASTTPAPAPAAPSEPAPEAQTPAAPEKAAKPETRGKTIETPRPAFARVDLGACRAAVEGCNEDGNAISVCLQRVKTCQAKPSKGCCPRACLQAFERRASADTSDAELFRQIFGEKGECRRLIGSR